jgi:hypothetical protein
LTQRNARFGCGLRLPAGSIAAFWRVIEPGSAPGGKRSFDAALIAARGGAVGRFSYIAAVC